MRWQSMLLAAATAFSGLVAGMPILDPEGFTPYARGLEELTLFSPGCSIPDFWRFITRLSHNAEIYFQGQNKFNTYSIRWSNVGTPKVNITILPATENDVVEIVRLANGCNIPFLAYNSAHGSITTLKNMSWGILINLRKLSGVTIHAANETATILGGTNSKYMIQQLWDAGYQAVTGTCECVNYMGPALGGGHGWLQGHYGLIADQFRSLNVVLANGTKITVGPDHELFWAMNGAGHNFGIVTSANIKIYPKIHTTYAIEILTFTGDKAKDLYEAAITTFANQPVEVIQWSYWMNIPQLDPTGPIIEFYIIQEGVTAVDSQWTAAFYALNPIAANPQTGSYLDLSTWLSINMDGPPCQKTGMANPRFPLYLESFNATAMEEVYEAFKAGTNSSGPFYNSLFMFEGYSMQGVQAKNASNAAFAWRNDNLLVAPLIQYQPGNPALDEAAKQFGNELRQILHRGSGRTEMHTYVNYAYGDETPEEWYGHESWRLTKLRQLKTKYDPNNRFSFYGPVN